MIERDPLETTQERLARRSSTKKGSGGGWGLVAAFALASYLTVEACLPPSSQPSAALAVGAIRAYQATVSPLLRCAGARCRYQPTCSRYGVAAIEKRGTLAGTAMTAWRILRCGPWGPPPGDDLP